MSQEPSAIDEHREERRRRIAALEAKLSRPPHVGVTPLVAAAVFAFSVFLLWGERLDIFYAFRAPTEPISLGAEGAYQFEAAQSNRYVEIHGVSTGRGWYWVERNTPVVAFGIADTPVILRRPTLATEKWNLGDSVAPRPDERPFTVRGRLLARADAPERYHPVFEEHEKWSKTKAAWLLLQGEKPGGDLGGQAWIVFLCVVAAVNAWLLVRGVFRLVSLPGRDR
jgi:hypothetical protein